MSPRFSTYLDAVRFLAALLVLISHLVYERFTGTMYAFVRELNLGSDAVMLFFVMSGFVIAFAADRKDPTLGRFVFNRASRLWSVALPALLLTLACDRLGAWLAPAAYDGWWYNPLAPLVMFAKGLSFSNEWFGASTRLGSNGPWWSLSYEAAFYALFAVAFYLRGPVRPLLLMAGVAAFGINIVLLMPAWLLGVYVYHRLEAGESRKTRADLFAMALFPLAAYVLFKAIDIPQLLFALEQKLLGKAAFDTLRFSDEFLWNGLIGLLFALHIYAVGQLLRSPAPEWRTAALVKWLAGASFSLYLVHYPVLSLLGVLLPKTAFAPLDHLLLLALTLAISFGFAALFERRLGQFRQMMREIGRRAKPLIARLSPAAPQRA